MQDVVKLVPGTEAHPRNRSMAHRLFIDLDGRFAPLKGDYVAGEEEGTAKTFVYFFEGPPYTGDPRVPTQYRANAINAIHARDYLLSTTPRTPHGLGFKLLWEKVDAGAPEAGFAKVYTDALAAYDGMVESCETYEEWEERHASFFDVATSYGREQLKALRKVYGGGKQNVEMYLRFRASESAHWQEIARPALEAQAAAREAEAKRLDAEQEAISSVATKFQELFESCSEEEKVALLKMYGQRFGADAPIQDMADVLGVQSGHDLFPELGDWIELKPGQAPPAFPASFSKPFDAPRALEEMAKAFPGAFPNPLHGFDFGQFAHPGFSGFAPGVTPREFRPDPRESFTMGDGVETDQRMLEAATGEADALRARLHADANENKRKVGLFKDVVAGGLRFLLEKIEGPAAPVPSEPVGPVEQLLAKTGVNGGRQSVMKALDELTAPVRPPVSTGAVGVPPEVGAPGEQF
jgi:hypothetical protein